MTLSFCFRPLWEYRLATTYKPPGDYLNEQVGYDVDIMFSLAGYVVYNKDRREVIEKKNCLGVLKKKMWQNEKKCEVRKEGKKTEGAPGFEPGTSRSAVECSTTELYPHLW